MFTEFIQKIKNHYAKNLPFVVYNKPNNPKISAFLSNNATQIAVDYTQKGFVMSAFQDERLTHFISQENADFIEIDLNTRELQLLNEAYQIHSSPDEASVYQNKIQSVVDYLATSEVQKIVYSRVVEVESKQSPFQAFENLLQLYPDAFTYLWYHPKLGTWLGATPESLLHLQRNQLQTMALAGTQLDTGKKNIRWGEKELEEQAFVTQAIVDALEKYSKKVNQSDVSTIKAGKLLHLLTTINASIEVADLKHVIDELHPTPAVAGLPKKEAIAYLLANENYSRKYYTGFLGEVNIPQQVNSRKHRKNQEFQAVQPRIPQTNLYVNLRCMEFTGKFFKLYVGGGITQASNAALEWEETQNKLQTMLNVL